MKIGYTEHRVRFLWFVALSLVCLAHADDRGRELLEKHFEWKETATYRLVYVVGTGEKATRFEIVQRGNPDGTVFRRQTSFRPRNYFNNAAGKGELRRAWVKIYTNEGVADYQICEAGPSIGFRYAGGIPRDVIKPDDEITATASDYNGVPCWKITQRRANGYVTERIVGQEPMCEYSSRMFSAGGASQGNVRLESIEFAPELSDDEFAVPNIPTLHAKI